MAGVKKIRMVDDLMPQMTLTVTVNAQSRNMAIRLWIFRRIMWLGALVLNCKHEVKAEK